jgi:hypothetical protein
MYEIGLAHAVHTAPEVILFRSDNDRLLFDVTHVRVNSYDPDHDETGACRKLADAITDALREVELIVREAGNSLQVR